MLEYDVIVLGGGTAGANAARTAAKEGAKTLLIHNSDYINLCVERGCMPSKSLLASSEMVLHGEMKADMEKILERKDRHVERFLKGILESFEVDPYDVWEGEASFLAQERGISVELSTGEKREAHADRYVIATGSKTSIPPIPGIEDANYLTSDDLMENKLTKIPSSIVIIGGGPIGLEFATFFSNLGTDVTLIEQGKLLPRFDPEFGEIMREALEAKGIVVLEETKVVGVESTTRSSDVSFEKRGEKKKETCKAEVLLIATGRAPNTEGLKVKNIALNVKKGGPLVCDDAMCTGVSNVYAAGDVTRTIQLLHAAAWEGRVAGFNAAHGADVGHVDFDFLSMSVIFSDPRVAHFGLSVSEAKERGKRFVVSSINFPETGRAITMGVEHGRWQLVVEKGTGKILGSTIVGPQADELIHQPFLVQQLAGTVDRVAELYAYHPTLSEQFINLAKDAAEKRFS
ncbi:MAG: FAD-dependent oxidoreductase [Candidatus Paceibacterota bacterium]